MAACGDQLVELLKNTSLEGIGCPGTCVVVSSDSSLEEAFTVLIENNIQSAPVSVKDAGGKTSYCGFLDVRDVVSFLALMGSHLTEGNFRVNDVVAAGGGSALDNVTVSYLARRNPFRPVAHDATLYDVTVILAGGNKRVPVLQDGALVNVISQSNIIQFVAKNEACLADAFKGAALQELAPWTAKDVLSVNHKESTLRAFEIMDNHKITGLAIVDDNNVVCGNVTGKDTKMFIKNPSYAQLHMPIGAMIKELRMSTDLDIRLPAITVAPTDSYIKVLLKLAATKVHRLYLVDRAGAPVGVVGLTDMIRALVPTE